MSSGISHGKFQPKRIRPSIKKDGINPRDYLKYDFRTSCEDCSHFYSQRGLCTLGYNTVPHRKAQQQKDYELSGMIAQCRFIEID
jgi:hypothetical protein